jgi:hypothetical protein
MPEKDPVLAGFDDLERVLEENARRAEAMRERMTWIRERRAEGLSWRELVPAEVRPLVVELLSDSTLALDRIGARVRRAEAKLLYDDGMTMDEIARYFGVSRQRVSGLLREARAGGASK